MRDKIAFTVRLLALAAAFCIAGTAWGATETVGGYTWTYRINGDTAEIYGNWNYWSSPAISPKPTGTVTIPSTLGGKPVTSIGDWAFSDCSGLTSVTIGNGVTSIGGAAFSGCSGLTSVTIPDSVTSIGQYAFSGCSDSLYDTARIPGVKLVDGWAVGYTSSLPSQLDLTGIRGIGYGAFSSCSGLASVTIPDSVTSIGNYAFSGCSGLKSIYIPDSVVNIQEAAFGDCEGLKVVRLPIYATIARAFDGCAAIEVVEISGTYSLDELFPSAHGIKTVIIKDGVTELSGNLGYYSEFRSTSAGSWMVSVGRANLTTVVIPNSVTNIGSSLDGCCGVKNLSLPPNLKGWVSFSGCSSLEEIDIPEGVEGLSTSAFYGCANLKRISLPESLDSIAEGAFIGCRSIESIIIAESNPNFAVRDGCLVSKSGTHLIVMSTSHGTVTIPDGILFVEHHALDCCKDMMRLVIPDSLSSVFTWEFNDCTNLEAYVVSDTHPTYSTMDGVLMSKDGSSIVAIPAKAKRVTIPDGMTVDAHTFDAYTYLSEIVVADDNPNYKFSGGILLSKSDNSIVAIPKGATSITIPDFVTTLDGAFLAKCRLLEELSIPTNVTYISTDTFNDCPSLRRINLAAGSPIVFTDEYFTRNTGLEINVTGATSKTLPTPEVVNITGATNPNTGEPMVLNFESIWNGSDFVLSDVCDPYGTWQDWSNSEDGWRLYSFLFMQDGYYYSSGESSDRVASIFNVRDDDGNLLEYGKDWYLVRTSGKYFTETYGYYTYNGGSGYGDHYIYNVDFAIVGCGEYSGSFNFSAKARCRREQPWYGMAFLSDGVEMARRNYYYYYSYPDGNEEWNCDSYNYYQKFGTNPEKDPFGYQIFGEYGYSNELQIVTYSGTPRIEAIYNLGNRDEYGSWRQCIENVDYMCVSSEPNTSSGSGEITTSVIFKNAGSYEIQLVFPTSPVNVDYYYVPMWFEEKWETVHVSIAPQPTDKLPMSGKLSMVYTGEEIRPADEWGLWSLECSRLYCDTSLVVTNVGTYHVGIGVEYNYDSSTYAHPNIDGDWVELEMWPWNEFMDSQDIPVNYTGLTSVAFSVLPRPVAAEQMSCLLPDNLVYDGVAKVLSNIIITNDYNGTALQEGVDYDVSYSDNVNPGLATATIICKGNYSGMFTKTFTIAPASFDLTGGGGTSGYSGGAGSVFGFEGEYDGSGHGLAIDVSALNDVAVRFAIAEEGPFVGQLLFTNVCDQTVWVELSAFGYNSYTGLAQVVISPKSIEGCRIDVESPVAYGGHAMQAAVSVVDEDLGAVLAYGVDYELEYSDNEVVGTAGVKVVGIGNYKDELERTFEIVKGTIRINNKSTWQWVGAEGFAFDGENKSVAFVSDGVVPNEVVDVEITGVTNAVHAGTYTAYANGTMTGFKTDDFYNYCYTTVLENVSCTWQIQSRSCDNCDASLSPGVMFHTGGGLEPEITVVDGGLGTTLARGVDYELNFRNNVNIGTAEVDVEFMGDYFGSKTLNFHVVDTVENLPKVRITPQSGIYEGRTGITLNYDGVEGVDCVVRYTLDGSEPTAESPVYSGKFTTNITGEMWLKVAAFSGKVRISEVSVSHIYPTIASIILEDGSDPVEFTNEKPLQWVLDDTVSGLDGRSAMRSSADVSDNGESVLAATFNGKGILMFKWKTSCEVDEPGYYYFDHAVCVADGEEVAWLDGITEWLDVSLTFEDEGEHTVVWKYVKDDADDGEYPGEDCAWLGMVSWTSTSAITLTFDAGDGSVEEGERMMRLNDPVGELPVPVWAHHDFAGWWTAGGVQVEAGARLYEDTALYAHWTLSRYAVSFDPNGGEVEAEDRHIEYGSAIGELPVPTWEGREFLGWFTAVDGGDAVSSETEVLDAVALFAHWRKFTFTVSFEPCGGIVDSEGISVEYEDVVGELPVPTWEGREFLGWFTAADGGEQVDDELQITDAVSLFAHWRKYTFTVSFNANGGEVEADDRVVEYGDTIGELPMPEYEHMEFLGWYTSAGARVAEDTVVTEDMPLRAEWRYAFSFGGDGVWNDIGEGVWHSGETSDSSTNSVSMEAHGEGTISFRWKVSCEDPVVIKDVIYRMDYLSFAIDGVERTCIYGTTDWASISFEVVGLGSHEFEWLYVKDSATSEGEDCGWIGEVVWTPRGPAIEGDDEATVEGDATSGYTVKPSEGNKYVVVTIPEGVDSERVTVEVSAEVETVTANGANVRVMKGEHDIAEHLDLEAVTQDGVINLAEAKVRDEVAKEALDTEKGAEIDISDPESPELTTAETKPGLTYTLREGATLEDMKDGDSKLGDGKKWTPNITVKGGASGFYTIKVEK